MLVGLALNRRRNDAANTGNQQPAATGKHDGIAMGQMPHQNNVPYPQTQQPVDSGMPYEHNQPQYAPTPQPHYSQPMPQYAQDPVNRVGTVSPVSHAGYSAPDPHTPELATPQHTGQPSYNVSELSAPQHAGGWTSNTSELSSHR